MRHKQRGWLRLFIAREKLRTGELIELPPSSDARPAPQCEQDRVRMVPWTR